MNIRHLFVTIAAVSLLGMTSCEKSSEPQQEPVSNEKQQQLAMDSLTVVAVTFDHFTSADDLKIVNFQDTSVVTVSKAVLTRTGQEIRLFNLFTGMTSVDDMPFYKRVESIKDNGESLTLTLSRADLGDFLSMDSVILSSDLYVNMKEVPREKDGGINHLHYVDTDSGYYHPIAIRQPVEPDAPLGEQTRAYEVAYRTTMIEEVEGSNFDWNINFIDVSPQLQGINLPLGDGYGDIGISKLMAHLYLGFRLKMEFGKEKVWWVVYKPVVNEFLASFRGGASVDAVARLAMKKPFDGPYERTLAKFAGSSYTFFIGPVPVVVSAQPSLVFQARIKGEVAFDFQIEAEAHADFEVGAHYYRNKGWSSVSSDKKPGASFTPSVNLDGSAKFNMGFYMKGAAKIYGAAGPTVMVGPQFTTEANGSFRFTDPDASSGKITCSVNLGGEVGAELTCLNWKLAKWAAPFTIAEFWHKTWEF